jgi:hypothetical protein
MSEKPNSPSETSEQEPVVVEEKTDAATLPKPLTAGLVMLSSEEDAVGVCNLEGECS